MSHIATPILAIMKLDVYRDARPEAFPSKGSLDWYVRQHRIELVKAGALVKHLGQWHAIPEPFDQYILEAGRRAAQAEFEK